MITHKHKSVYTITGRYMHSTENAIQFRVDQVSGVSLPFPKVEWFPLSQIDKTFRDPNKHEGDWLIVSGWILDKKGIKIPVAGDLPTSTESSTPKSDTHLSGGHFDANDDDDIPF